MARLLLSFAGLLLIASVSNALPLLNDDGASYNPCDTESGVFFYPDPLDTHKYYQCDESGITYSRSCNNLVWDDFQKTCNWPSAVVQRVIVPSIPTTTTTAASTTTTADTTTTIDTTTTTDTTTLDSTTIDNILITKSSSTTVSSRLGLCNPVNPCGKHGTCHEFVELLPGSVPSFVCVCADNWIGRYCDIHIDELTTPSNLNKNKAVLSFPHLDKLITN